MARLDDGFRAFVADSEQQLLGTALLLTGDPADADDLLVAALARTHRHWRRLGSAEAALADTRTALVAGLLDRTALPDPGPVSQGVQDGDRVGPADRAWLQALAALDPRTRAVVVLRLHEGWDDDAVAALLGCSPGTAAAALADALHVLGPLAAPEPAPAATVAPVTPAVPVPAAAPDTEDGDPYAAYRRPGTAPARPRREPVATAAPAPAPSPAPSGDDPYAIYRRPR